MLFDVFGVGKKSGKKSGKKGGRGGSRKGGGKANVGCGTGSGGFAKGNTCRRGGGGTGEKPGGPVSHKARADGKKEEWMQYKYKDGFPTDKIVSMKGLPAKINVEKGPPRNAREEKLLAKAEKVGKEAVVRTSKRSAYTEKEGSQKHFHHGGDRIATVLPTKDVARVKPTIGGKPYNPADHERTKSSKFTVIHHGGQVSGHPSQAKADKVARSHVKAERTELSKASEFALVKDHQSSNLVKGTEFGREPRSVLTIRVLTKSGGVEDLSMKKNTFNEELCRKRRRVAAIRDGIDAPPVSFHKSTASLYTGVWEDKNLLASWGDAIPSDSDAVALINESFANGRKPLTSNDVYIHWAEAANGNYIDDRFMFLDHSTLRNIAGRAGDGFAFMNSHRTGGLSAPAEMPYGRTFAGRYEEAEKDGILYRRALIGLYMLKGTHPNGKLGPSTDDFHAGILGGIFKDVSMGLTGGSRICDVCVRELGDEKCKHVPGTHEGLKADQIKAQEGRGVSRGMSSYTLVDAMPQEVSAVFKGAVPGAAFRKVRMHAKNRLYVGQSVAHSEFGSEVLLSYGGLLDGRERLAFGPKKGSKGVAMPRNPFKDLLKHYRDAGSPDPDMVEEALFEVQESDHVDVLPPIRSEDREKLAADREKLAREIAEFDRNRAEHMRNVYRMEGDGKLAPYVSDGRISPFERNNLLNLYVIMASDDAARPATDADGKPIHRTDLLFSGLATRKPSGLMSEEVGTEPVVHDDESVLSNGSASAEGKVSAERLRQLLGHTEMGKAGLSDLRK